MTPGRAQGDPHPLARFVAAQDGVYRQVLTELSAGAKRSHWMWFIFPQLKGLGSSEMAQRFAIRDWEEARAYLAHATLGPRLLECTGLVNSVSERSIEDIFGYPDYLKFRSSMSLFAAIAPEQEAFRTALDQYFHGEPDPATVSWQPALRGG